MAQEGFWGDVALLGGLVPWWGILIALTLTLAAPVAGVALYRSVREHRRPKWSTYTRIRARLWPGPGFADAWVIWRDYGRRRPRKIAKVRRPTLRLKHRWFGPSREYAVFQGWAHGLPRRMRIFTSLEDNTLTIAPPQEGKSVTAVPKIWEAPGACIVNTIRGDLLRASAGFRATLGRVHVFNPGGLGALGSTFKWSPLTGCRSFDTAVLRAGYMVEADRNSGLANDDFWKDQTSMVLASYLHAAALVMDDQDQQTEREGADWDQLRHEQPEPVSVRTVYAWTAAQSLVPYEVLRLHPGANIMALENLKSFYENSTTPERTRGSITTTLKRTLKFMLTEAVAEALTVRPGDSTFNADEFVRSKDTLYMISPRADQRSPIAPLMTAFLAELYTTAVDADEERRLEAPMTAVLDEPANSVPVPLEAWTSASAGSGVVLHLFPQSVSQLVRCWGREAADEILNNCKALMIWPSVGGASRAQLDSIVGTVRLVRKDKRRASDGTEQSVPHESWESALPNPGVDIPNNHVLFSLRKCKPVILIPPAYYDDQRFTAYSLPALPKGPVHRVPEAIPELIGTLRDSGAPSNHLPSGPARPRALESSQQSQRGPDSATSHSAFSVAEDLEADL